MTCKWTNYLYSACRKKEFVFRLRTSDQAEFLFQTSDEQELRAWVDTVNTVVAR
jgi:PH/SEC7 domain-containing protein